MLLIGQPSISMGHLFHSYVSLPEGNYIKHILSITPTSWSCEPTNWGGHGLVHPGAPCIHRHGDLLADRLHLPEDSPVFLGKKPLSLREDRK